MIPENVLSAVRDQLRPLVMELARYTSSDDSIQMVFEVGSVTFEFNKSDEIVN
jgi:hypothetical protein